MGGRKVTPEIAAEIRAHLANGLQHLEVARIMGLARNTIGKYVSEESHAKRKAYERKVQLGQLERKQDRESKAKVAVKPAKVALALQEAQEQQSGVRLVLKEGRWVLQPVRRRGKASS